MTPPSPPPVLIFAPLGRDAPLLRRALEAEGIPATICPDAGSLSDCLEGGAGALLLTQEALPTAWPLLEPLLRDQPAWSDLPLIVLVNASDARAGAARLAARNVTLLERPVRGPTLLSVVRAALLARGRQREVRDLLADLQGLTSTLEDRVRSQTSRVRDLSAALTLAEQAERQRLSELLHDHLQQLLFGLQLRLQFLDIDAPPAQRAEHLALARQLLTEAIQLTRTLSVELHPPVLDEDGLTVAVEWVAAQMREQHGLEVSVEAAGPCSVPSRELLILLTRSVRELLFNVVKHADTQRARVDLATEGGVIRVTVHDEGVGYDPEEIAARRFTGTGLRALDERLRLLGGSVTTASQPGRGTTTVLEVPMPPGPDASGAPEA